MSNKNETKYISGKCMWAKLQRPDLSYDKTKEIFTIDVIIDDADADIFTKNGIRVKEKDGVKSVKIKTNAVNAKTGERMSVQVVHKGQPFTGLIGNGSDVTVAYTLYESKFANNSLILRGVRIDELVKYVDNSAPFECTAPAPVVEKMPELANKDPFANTDPSVDDIF